LYDEFERHNVGATVAALRGLGRNDSLIWAATARARIFRAAGPVSQFARRVLLIGRMRRA